MTLRHGDRETVTVPAGSFDTHTIHTTVGGQTTDWSVEVAWPHRLIRWASSTGEVAELLGTSRTAYWNQHDEGDEAALQALGHPLPAPAWAD